MEIMSSLSWSGCIAVRCVLDPVEVAVPSNNAGGSSGRSRSGSGGNAGGGPSSTGGSSLPPPVIQLLPRGAYLPRITKQALVRICKLQLANISVS